MKSEKGVTLISLLTYIALMLTIMVVIGRITGFFTKGLDNVDEGTQASADFSKVNYCFLKETKKTQEKSNITAAIDDMDLNAVGYEFPTTATPTDDDKEGTAIKFMESGNVLSYVNEAIYYNKIKVCDKVTNFKIKYKAEEKAIEVNMKIDGEDFDQTYTFR